MRCNHLGKEHRDRHPAVAMSVHVDYSPGIRVNRPLAYEKPAQKSQDTDQDGAEDQQHLFVVRRLFSVWEVQAERLHDVWCVPQIQVLAYSADDNFDKRRDLLSAWLDRVSWFKAVVSVQTCFATHTREIRIAQDGLSCITPFGWGSFQSKKEKRNL